MSDLREEVEKWLKKQGYPLEMETARAMRLANFGVVQSEHFPDPDEDKWRETDVIGYEEARGETCRAIFALCVECKSSISKPWVLFTSFDEYPHSLGVSRRATSEQGKSILNVLALKDEIKANLLFQLPIRPGYGVKVALSKDGHDPAYAALNSVGKAALGVVQRLSNPDLSNIIPVAWPVIVIEAPLFESYLGADGELKTEEIDKGLLVWKNPLVRRHSLIEIWRKERFFSDLKSLNGAAHELLVAVASENDRSPRNEHT